MSCPCITKQKACKISALIEPPNYRDTNRCTTSLFLTQFQSVLQSPIFVLVSDIEPFV